MNKDDYPLVEFEGHRLRIVPELDNDQCMCTMCVAYGDRRAGGIDNGLCGRLRGGGDCGYHGGEERGGFIYLPEENFTEYIVEVVRRRVS